METAYGEIYEIIDNTMFHELQKRLFLKQLANRFKLKTHYYINHVQYFKKSKKFRYEFEKHYSKFD